MTIRRVDDYIRYLLCACYAGIVNYYFMIIYVPIYRQWTVAHPILIFGREIRENCLVSICACLLGNTNHPIYYFCHPAQRLGKL